MIQKTAMFCFSQGLACSLVTLFISTGAAAGTVTGELAPQKWQISAFGDAANDDGDLNLYLAGSVDWVVWQRFFLHYSLGFEQKLNSYLRMRNAIGVGYLYETGRSSLPVWVAPGITTTGLWNNYLNREFIGLGAGYRYHFGPRAGLGANFEFIWFGEGVSEQRLTVGFIYSVR